MLRRVGTRSERELECVHVGVRRATSCEPCEDVTPAADERHERASSRASTNTALFPSSGTQGFAVPMKARKRTAEVPNFFESIRAEPQQRVISTTYAIPGLSSIPNSESEQKHKVSIAHILLDTVELTWITVPSEIPSVFIQVRIREFFLSSVPSLFSALQKSNAPYSHSTERRP